MFSAGNSFIQQLLSLCRPQQQQQQQQQQHRKGNHKMLCLPTPVKVQTVTTGITYDADVALMNQVKRKVKLEGTNWDGKCLIVFCPITSRVGSDVEAAMQNIPFHKKILLVLMHHTRDPDYSTAGTLWSERFPNIDLEVHVLFHESVPGLLTSSKNTEAVYRMQKYLEPPEENNWMLVVLLVIVLFVIILWFSLN